MKNNKLNVLILFDVPWWNAAAYYTYYIVITLIQLGCNVSFAGKSGTPIWNRLTEMGIRMYDIRFYKPTPLSFLKSYFSVNKAVKNDKINLMIPVSSPAHIICGLLRKLKHTNIPVIKFCFENVAPVNNFLNRYLHKKLTSALVFPGESTKKRYNSIFNPDCGNYKILHAPLDIKAFIDFKVDTKVNPKIGIPENKIIVSFIGRFSPEKGIYFLIDIIKIASALNDELYFILSGSEEQIKYSDVKKVIEENHLSDKVAIIKKLNDVRDLLAVTDIGIMSSRYSEYICRIAMEFMAFRIPVVAPDLNVIPEVIDDNVSGFIYPLNDSAFAAEKIIELAGSVQIRKKMGLNGLNKVQQDYSLARFSAELQNILKKVLS